MNEDFHNDESQLISIRNGVSSINTPLEPNISIIKGPPGTGKTKTIIGIIQTALNAITENRERFINSNKKIMICAPSNLAVDEILLRIKKNGIYMRNSKSVPFMIRLGRTTDENVEEYELFVYLYLYVLYFYREY